LTEDGGMDKHKRSADEIRRMVDEFHSSGQTRQEFCQRHQIAVTTLDYWRRAQSRSARLVKVEVAASKPAGSFTLSLANGRRIESQWSFGEAELARLIRVAESA
jgi:transposase-like protein